MVPVILKNHIVIVINPHTHMADQNTDGTEKIGPQYSEDSSVPCTCKRRKL